jgi:hypothetical protein
MGSFSSPKYLQDSLLDYVMSISNDKKNIITVKMPVNLILMTPYYEFDLYEIP